MNEGRMDITFNQSMMVMIKDDDFNEIQGYDDDDYQNNMFDQTSRSRSNDDDDDTHKEYSDG